jgi:hypothetical protein
MEEMTVEILTDGGGRANLDQVKEISALGRRVGEAYDRGKRIHIKSDAGTDLTARIGEMPPSYHADRWGRIPFGRNAPALAGGTWPWAKRRPNRSPAPPRTVVGSTQFPPGRWRKPVGLTIKTAASLTSGQDRSRLGARFWKPWR